MTTSPVSEFERAVLKLQIAGTQVAVIAWYTPTKDKDRHRVRLQDMEASNPVLLRMMLAESLDHIQRAFCLRTGFSISRSTLQDWIMKIQPSPAPLPGGFGHIRTPPPLCRCPRCQSRLWSGLHQRYDLEPHCPICGYVEYQ